jgi:protein gp37
MTTIEWATNPDGTAGESWNPVRGCTKVSPGCKHCYAETFAERWRDIPGHPYEQGFDLRLVPEALTKPFRWAKPRTVFVNSMSDLFHDDIPDLYIENVLNVMNTCDWHTFIVLTKRPVRMKRFILGRVIGPNVWLGVSVEDWRYGVPRIDYLRSINQSTKLLSVEPLLEDLGKLDLRDIEWVIVGGESGPGARPMSGAWVRNIRDQCIEAGVPFFFKQWGVHNEGLIRVGKKQAGRLLDGRTWDQRPTFTIEPPPTNKERHRRLAAFEVKR